MHKLTIIALSMVGVLGCSSPGGPGPVPNTYQPVTVDELGCPEIEYRWEKGQETGTEFYPGEGGFCIFVDKDPGTPIEARCVVRRPNGEIFWTGRWVPSVWAESPEQFYELCPEARPD